MCQTSAKGLDPALFWISDAIFAFCGKRRSEDSGQAGQFSAAGYGVSSADCRVSYGVSSAGYGVRSAGYGVRSAGYGVRSAGYGVRSAGHGTLCCVIDRGRTR
jgi:hypothetical protein